MNETDANVEILLSAAKELKPLKFQLVFLGGATISLFVTEPHVVTIRETFDVDCVVEVVTRNDYEVLSAQLRKLGFHEDQSSAVICRFKKNALILDVIPTNPKILGFENKWYDDGFKNCKSLSFGSQTIAVFDLPYLVATKLEAFKGRGRGEYLYSHDIEDIVTLLDGRPSIADDLASSEVKVRKYLINEFKNLMQNSKFLGALEAHISDRENLAARKAIILKRMQDFLES